MTETIDSYRYVHYYRPTYGIGILWKFTIDLFGTACEHHATELESFFKNYSEFCHISALVFCDKVIMTVDLPLKLP